MLAQVLQTNCLASGCHVLVNLIINTGLLYCLGGPTGSDVHVLWPDCLMVGPQTAELLLKLCCCVRCNQTAVMFSIVAQGAVQAINAGW